MGSIDHGEYQADTAQTCMVCDDVTCYWVHASHERHMCLDCAETEAVECYCGVWELRADYTVETEMCTECVSAEQSNDEGCQCAPCKAAAVETRKEYDANVAADAADELKPVAKTEPPTAEALVERLRLQVRPNRCVVCTDTFPCQHATAAGAWL